MKEYLENNCLIIPITPPYKLKIEFEGYCDIDNPIKVIIDAIKKTITDDRDIHELTVTKRPIKRGLAGYLKVWIGTKESGNG